MLRKKLLFSMTLILIITLSACSSKTEDSVNVFRADQLMNAGEITNRYVGMIVSENTIKVQKDYSKAIDELLVEEGQKVNKGDTLFIYDVKDLDIQLDRCQLEIDKSYAVRSNIESSITDYEKELETATDEVLISQIKNNIDRAKNEMLSIDYTIEGQRRDYNRVLEEMDNVKVKAPVSGTIKKIDESGQAGAYITIQQDGSYKVKATINEMNMGSGLIEGSRVKVISRTDADKVWFGEVKTIDLQGNSQNNEMMGGFNDPMSQSTSYSFYVELDNTDGLLLGQHVYVELVLGEEKSGLWLPNYFVFDENHDETTNVTTAEVWAANSNDKIEKRHVTLGVRDDNNGSVEILDGLSNDDYVADPKNTITNGMSVEYHNASDFELEVQEPNIDMPEENLPIEDNALVEEENAGVQGE